MAAPAKSLFYAFGPQGETRQLTNSTGSVVDSYGYTAWGQALSSTGTDVNPFQYGGKVGYCTVEIDLMVILLIGYMVCEKFNDVPYKIT